MPRHTTTPVDPLHGDTPLEQLFEDMRTMLTAKRAEYQAAADRISDIIGSITPKPRIGRPPRKV